MIDLILFLRVALRAYRAAGECGSYYIAVTRNGVPRIGVFVATGREAWRTAVRAIEEFELK